jgi:DNA invertase Pin-like site-specific DNA recombinase
VFPGGRKLRVLIQARYSTEGQRQASIEDQIANCRRFLAENLPSGMSLDQLDIEEINEPEISGEQLDRPGINRIRAGIKTSRWDVILAEESSRFFRDAVFAGQLFYEAVDAGIRVICPSDGLDTAESDWMGRLMACQAQHSGSNDYTRLRILRALTGNWERGAAVCVVKLGYRRRPTRPATASEPAEGPFFDEVDEAQAPIIREIFERVASDEPLWAVASWLTSIQFAKAKNSQSPEWSDSNVKDLVRRPDYRGVQEYRKRTSKQQLTTGRSRSVRNDPKAVLTREMPALRIVSDHVWFEANAAIDRRCTSRDVPKGADHQLAGKPRDSRGPLSTIFRCGICGGIMHAEGRNEGGYRCAGARKGKCWNRTTCLRDQAHEAILGAVARAVMSIADCREELVARVLELQSNGGDLAAEQRALESKEAKLTAAIDTLGRVIESGGDETETLVQRLKDREHDRRLVRSQLAELASRSHCRKPPPSPQDIMAHLEALMASLLANDSRAGVILRQVLDGPIRAIPYQQFGCTKVVLRAEFTVTLTRALPPEVAGVAEADPVAANLFPEGVQHQMLVDLFVPSQIARHAMKAHELANKGMTLVEIGNALGILKKIAGDCNKLGKLIVAAGATEPFVRLDERPEKVARWRGVRPNHDDDGHRKAS